MQSNLISATLALALALTAQAAAKPPENDAAHAPDLPHPATVMSPADHELRLDLDGDGLPDRTALVSTGGRTAIQVTWGRGETELLTEIEAFEDGELLETMKDFSWIVGWRAALKTGPALTVPVLFDTVHVVSPEVLGDALHVTSTDVAALIYLTDDGWRLEHLGY